MEPADEPSERVADAVDDDLIVPVGARASVDDAAPPSGWAGADGSAEAIGTPVEAVPDVPVARAVAAKRPAPAAPAWTRVDAREGAGVVDGLTEDGALPPRPRPSYTPHLLAASAVLLLCVAAAWWWAVSEQRARERRAFLEHLERAPDDALRRADDLPAWLRDDPEVQLRLEVMASVRGAEAARAAAERLLARAASADTLDERLALCDEAARATPTWATPRARKAEALLLVARRDLAAALLKDPQAAVSFDAAAPALQELDAALALTATDAELADLLLVRARLCLAAPGDPGARRRAAADAVDRATRGAASGATWNLASATRLALVGQWQAALEGSDRALALALARDVASVAAHLLRGEAHLRRGDPAAAVAAAREAQALDARCVDAVALEAEARWLGVRAPTPSVRSLALEDLERALAYDPGAPRALAARAYARLTRDRFGLVTSTPADRQAARADAELAVRLDPGQALAHAALAELAFAAGDVARALEAAARAVEHEPALADLHVLRGRLRARTGDRGALDDFEAALRLRPVDPRALTNRAALLLARGDAALAHRAADLATSYDAALPEAYLQRGLAAYKATDRKLQRAVDDLSRALSLDAGLADAWFYRACALHDAAMPTEALQDLDRAEVARLERGAFHARDVFLVRGHCLFKLKRWREAEAAYDEFLRLAGSRPTPPTLVRRLGRVRDLLAGRIDEAAIDVAKE